MESTVSYSIQRGRTTLRYLLRDSELSVMTDNSELRTTLDLKSGQFTVKRKFTFEWLFFSGIGVCVFIVAFIIVTSISQGEFTWRAPDKDLAYGPAIMFLVGLALVAWYRRPYRFFEVRTTANLGIRIFFDPKQPAPDELMAGIKALQRSEGEGVR